MSASKRQKTGFKEGDEWADREDVEEQEEQMNAEIEEDDSDDEV